MNTLVEIQDAIVHLTDNERKALQLWLNSQAGPELLVQEEQHLMCSLADAVRDIDADKGVPIDDVRERVSSWAAK